MADQISKKTEHGTDSKIPVLDKNDITDAQKIQKLLGGDKLSKEAQEELEKFTKNFKFLGANADGTEGIFKGQSGQYQIGGGHIGIDSPLPNNDPKRIESLIEMAALAHKSFRPGTEIDVSGGSEESRMVSEKIAQMASLKVHIDEKKLADINPELDKKINETYDKVREKYGLPPRADAVTEFIKNPIVPAMEMGVTTPAPAALKL
ncbi:MAG: hypothetical protein WBK55_01640 [Alphaproteobacteria bacterium]